MGLLDDKRALITGGTRGIGAATAARFASEGAQVLVCARDVQRAPVHPMIRAVEADVTDVDAVARAIALAGQGDRLDVCVANAGAALVEGFLESEFAEWERLLRVNLLSMMVTFQIAAAEMIADGRGGRLLANASVAALRGEASSAAYSASKGGAITLVQALAVELAPAGITVNAVAPGEIDTALHAEAVEDLAAHQGKTVEDVLHTIVGRIPARRMGRPEEVAAVFAFLASDEAAYITGETVRVDGGELLV